MSEPTTGPETDPGQTTSQGTPPGSGTSPASQVPTAPAPPESLPVPPTSNNLGERTAEEIRRDWDHQRGEIMARNSDWETWRGQMQQIERSLRDENRSLQRQVQELEGREETLSNQLEQTQEQVSQLPDLQQQAQRAQRLQVILQYPSIVAQTEVRTSEGEDGQQIEERVNPYLDLLLDSNKSGDEYVQAVAELDARLRGQAASADGGPSANAYDMQLTPPQPPAPTGPAAQLADLERQRDEARNAGNYEAFRSLEDQILRLEHQSE